MIVDDEGPERPLSEKLDREGGVFVEPDAHEVTCEPDAEHCAPDEYVNDPDDRAPGIPGTADDAPPSFGVETESAADQHLVLEGTIKAAGESREEAEAAEDQGAADEGELWSEQAPLLDEDEASGIQLEDFSEDEISEILDAIGDDAQEPLPDSPEGTSATGEWSSREHGGFPERNE